MQNTIRWLFKMHDFHQAYGTLVFHWVSMRRTDSSTTSNGRGVIVSVRTAVVPGLYLYCPSLKTRRGEGLGCEPTRRAKHKCRASTKERVIRRKREMQKGSDRAKERESGSKRDERGQRKCVHTRQRQISHLTSMNTYVNKLRLW